MRWAPPPWARALAAHQNSLEAFPPFAVALIAAVVGGGDPARVHLLAIVWLVARVAYVVCYLADTHLLRSLTWAVGVASVFALMALPMLAG